MWGHHGWRAGAHWEWAGKWAARADDVLSWLPARLSALLLAVGVGGLPLGRLWREAGRTASPNCGWPMAAMAMARGTRLRKPGDFALNDGQRSPVAADTARAIQLGGRAVLLLAAWSLLMVAALRWGRL
jgi:adenosylcobinamide-phosphate synthase